MKDRADSNGVTGPGNASQAGRVSPLALAILAALIVGLAAWATSWHRVPTAKLTVAAPPSPADTAVDDAAIDRALAIARPDSAAFKSRWLDEVRNVDYTDLDPARREIFLRFANAERCTCGCGYTLAGCLASDMTCEVSGGRVRALLDSVRAGRIRSARSVRARPSSGG